MRKKQRKIYGKGIFRLVWTILLVCGLAATCVLAKDLVVPAEESNRKNAGDYVPLKERIKNLIPEHAKRKSPESIDSLMSSPPTLSDNKNEVSPVLPPQPPENGRLTPAATPSYSLPITRPAGGFRDRVDQIVAGRIPLPAPIPEQAPEPVAVEVKEELTVNPSPALPDAVPSSSPLLEVLPFSAPDHAVDSSGYGFALPDKPLLMRIRDIIPEHARRPHNDLDNIPEAPSTKIATESPVLSAPVPVQEKFQLEVLTSQESSPDGIFAVSFYENGIRLESNSELSGTPVMPGETMTLSLRIVNNTEKSLTFLEELTMPEGFALAFPTGEFSLAAGEEYNSLIMITVPRAVSAGLHKISYEVAAQENPAVRGSLSFNFNIKAQTELRFLLEDKPDSVVGGKDFTVTGKILNKGNVNVKARLFIPGQRHFKGTVSPEHIEIAPGASKDIAINIFPTREATRNQWLHSYLQAESTEDGKTRNLLNQIISMRMFTLAGNSMDFYRRLPVYFVTNAFGDSDKNYTQYELKARGAINASGTRVVDLFVRSNNPEMGYSGWNKRDEARFEYRTPVFRARVGEHNFTISRLTGSIGSTKGFGVEFSPSESLKYGFSDFTTRWRNQALSGQNFFFAHRPFQWLELSLNHQISTNQKLLDRDEVMSTVGVKLKPDSSTTIDGEFGRSSGSGDSGGNDRAYVVNIGRKFKNNVNVRLNRTEIGPDYGGGLMGSDITSAEVSAPLSRSVTTDFSYSTSEQNPSKAVTVTSAAKDRRIFGGVRYRMTRTLDFNLSLTENHRWDKLNFGYDYLEKTWRGGFTEMFRGMRLGYNLERVNRFDHLTGMNNWNTRHRITSFFRGSSKVNFNVYAGISQFGSDGAALPADYDEIGVSFLYRLLDNLSFNLQYTETFYDGPAKNRSRINMLLAYKFADTSSLELRIRNDFDWWLAEGPTYYELIYSKYLGLAVGRDETLGGLRGMVFERVGSETVPLANVTLLMETMAAVSDSQGRFLFAYVKPGMYNLNLDRRSTGIEKIAVMKMPVEVEIKGGALSRLDIEVMNGANFSGTFVSAATQEPASVDLQGDAIFMPSSSKSLEPEQLANILVEIVSINDETQIHRRLTNTIGAFSFVGLTPGKYRYKAYAMSMPEGYQIDSPEGEIELLGNVANTLDFTVSPRIRKIQMMDEE